MDRTLTDVCIRCTLSRWCSFFFALTDGNGFTGCTTIDTEFFNDVKVVGCRDFYESCAK